MSPIRRNFFITLGSIILIDGAIIGVFLVLLQWFILPLAERFLAVQKEIAVAERQVQDFKALVAPSLQKNSMEIEALRNSFFIYSSEKSLQFIETLESMAKRNNLTYQIGEFQTGSPPTQIIVTGSFANIAKFLREFENGETLFQISGLTLVESNASMSATVQFSLAKL